MRQPRHTEARPYCYRCDRPQSMCLCDRLAPIPNEVGVHVLQHPRERRHALNTARFLRLGLASVHVHVLAFRGQSAESDPLPLPEGAGLLYPSADARDLTTLTASERPEHLVVIDGTWDQAHRIFRDNPWISALPRYRLDPEQGSAYRIRSEPRDECLSTVESVVAALRCLQPDLQGTETLLAAFDGMIDAQIEASARPSTHARGKRPRKGPSRSIPEVLSRSEARVIVVYAEAAPSQEAGGGPRCPIRLTAVSLDGARVFDRLVRVDTAPEPDLLEKMGLDATWLSSAQPYDEVLDAFRGFCGASSPQAPLVLVSWNVWTHRWLGGSLGDVPCVLLRAVWANVSRARVPALGTLVEGLGLATLDLPVTGRAGGRLLQAHAMARHILSGGGDARQC